MYKPPRLYTHMLLALLTAAAVYATSLYVPRASLNYTTMLGTAYVALALTVVTLAIGTLKLFDGRRRNPVNINLRRDIGVWAGITGVVHAVLGFGVHSGPAVLPYYVRWTDDGAIRPLTNAFGLSNYAGTVAAVILVALLLTSNDIALRWLRGQKWKALQRWNYWMTALVFLHTFLYQMISSREAPFVWLTIGLGGAAVIAQAAGYALVKRRLQGVSHARAASS